MTLHRIWLAISWKAASAASHSLCAASRSGVPAIVASRAIEAAMTRSKAARHCSYKSQIHRPRGRILLFRHNLEKEGSANLVPELALAHPTGSSLPARLRRVAGKRCHL
jgi:hypothetical protein